MTSRLPAGSRPGCAWATARISPPDGQQDHPTREENDDGNVDLD